MDHRAESVAGERTARPAGHQQPADGCTATAEAGTIASLSSRTSWIRSAVTSPQCMDAARCPADRRGSPEPWAAREFKAFSHRADRPLTILSRAAMIGCRARLPAPKRSIQCAEDDQAADPDEYPGTGILVDAGAHAWRVHVLRAATRTVTGEKDHSDESNQRDREPPPPNATPNQCTHDQTVRRQWFIEEAARSR